ncbi:hypothetical protein SLS60_003049 [Paraconiothyrium brasiliense]|uniref:Uncharacterized protein n=1 Tax=Paraconiothyrium brasiliense TaxID=300254 RepID=A0ABR3RUK4_9PLEO
MVRFNASRISKEKAKAEEVITTPSSAPPVPAIPAKYRLYPTCKQNSLIPPTPPFAKQRPDTGRSASSSRAVPHVPQLIASLMTPYSEEGGLPKSPTSTANSVSSVRDPELAPQSPSEETFKRPSSTASSASSVLQHKYVPRPPKGTTFGVPREVWEDIYADHPEIIRFKEHIHNDGPPIEEMVYSPGIPASDYHRYKANFEATGSPFESTNGKGKKDKTVPQPSSSKSLTAAAPFPHDQHEVKHFAPLDPASRFYANRAAASSTKTLKSMFKSSSAVTTPTNPEFAPLSHIVDPQTESNRKFSSSSRRPASKESRIASTSSSSGSRFSVGTSSLERSSKGRLKPKKSLRDLFQRSSSSSSSKQPGPFHISRPVLVPQPGSDSDVPPLPATVKFTKPPGPPPTRPQRPHEEVDQELTAMRGSGVTRLGFGSNNRVPRREMGIRTPSGEVYERYNQERYTVKRIGKGMLIRDSVTGTKEFVEDI